MKNKKILITGGNGFIGRNLSEELSKENQVIVLDKSKTNNKNVAAIQEDIVKKDWLQKTGHVDYIFHLAANVGVDYVSKTPEETRVTEILGMRNILCFAKENPVKKIIYSSTSSVYEAIHSPTAYNISKLYAEQLLRDSGLNHTILRLFNVYGKYQQDKMVVPRFIQKALNNEPITIFGDGNQTRDFTYIKDIVNAIIISAKTEKANSRVFDIGTGTETKIIELAKVIVQLTNSDSKIIKGPVPEHRRHYEVIKRCCNPKPMIKMLGFECQTNLKKGINDLINSFC
ncbi:MAG: NAD-dependent epimerase/dehydratase family protein [Bacteroidota bacterium]